MPSTLRDSLPMLLGLALLTGVGYLLVSATGRSWFEHDVQMRAELAVRGARRGSSAAPPRATTCADRRRSTSCSNGWSSCALGRRSRRNAGGAALFRPRTSWDAL